MSAGRIIAIVLGASLLLAGVLFVVGYSWLQKQAPRLKAAREAALAEGREFGASTDDHGCLAESLERYDRCENGFVCNAMNSVFFSGCLTASAPAAGFCDGVPPRDSVTASVVWRLNQCGRSGRSDSYCSNFFGELQRYCDSSSRRPDD